MKNLRKYGKAPLNTAVIHGGPGAPGEMAPVARELSSLGGVLEPLQTEASIEGQVRELKDILQSSGNLPVILIGWSWGAWLSFIFSAQHPAFVKKLILIGSGPFEEKYTLDIMEIRLSRLNQQEKEEVLSLFKILDDPCVEDKDTLFARLGKLISKADSYDPLPHKSEILECQYGVYHKVWDQASKLRSSGELLEFGRNIQCPVVAVHGDYDPHPAEGVKGPLSRILKDFRFILLEKCGHQPWIERCAKDRFYDILKSEMGL
jgi:pimeloyl-ACP methyl ester carboxylesterase